VFNRAGKILSILAMMVVAINAQCALSCSFQAAQPQKPEAHSCCKDHKSPASHKPKPCPETTVSVADVHKSQAPMFSAVVIHILPDATVPVCRYAAAPAARAPNLPDIPSFSILRI
jgi:hypothetical protein